ncbi:MAG TPA: hypothetical protein VN937_19890 [Blastocatellia bacterium]|nr:hypothetical protein [Blastocatellia bacterium]
MNVVNDSAMPRRRSALMAMAAVFICSIIAFGQYDKKPYLEWSENEANKIMNNSPWSQTHTLTDTSKAFNTSRGRRTAVSTASNVVKVNFRIRFLSSHPVRQAISRLALLHDNKIPEQMLGRLKALAEAPFPDYVVVAVTTDSDRGSDMLTQANETLQRATTAVLINKTYLITNTGQRVFLKEYQAPRNDGFGARFIFPRIIDGKEMLTAGNGEVVFHAEMGGGSDLNSGVTTSDTANGYGFTLQTRYKVKEMMFNGKLDY